MLCLVAHRESGGGLVGIERVAEAHGHAGWGEEEHTRFGLPFSDVETRWQLLEEQVPIVHGLLTEDSFSFEGAHYRQMEIEYGAFHRRLELGEDVDVSSASATYERGMLRIVLPLDGAE